MSGIDIGEANVKHRLWVICPEFVLENLQGTMAMMQLAVGFKTISPAVCGMQGPRAQL